jgi:hypothetical protein
MGNTITKRGEVRIMRIKDILLDHPTIERSVVAFVSMEGNIAGKVLLRLEYGTNSDVLHNAQRVQVFILNDRLRRDPGFQREVWRRMDMTGSLRENAHRLGLTLDQVILMHLLQAVSRGYVNPTGPDTFSDTLDWWGTRKGRSVCRQTALEFRVMWEQVKRQDSNRDNMGKRN